MAKKKKKHKKNTAKKQTRSTLAVSSTAKQKSKAQEPQNSASKARLASEADNLALEENSIQQIDSPEAETEQLREIIDEPTPRSAISTKVVAIALLVLIVLLTIGVIAFYRLTAQVTLETINSQGQDELLKVVPSNEDSLQSSSPSDQINPQGGVNPQQPSGTNQLQPQEGTTTPSTGL